MRGFQTQHIKSRSVTAWKWNHHRFLLITEISARNLFVQRGIFDTKKNARAKAPEESVIRGKMKIGWRSDACDPNCEFWSQPPSVPREKPRRWTFDEIMWSINRYEKIQLLTQLMYDFSKRRKTYSDHFRKKQKTRINNLKEKVACDREIRRVTRTNRTIYASYWRF